LFKNGEYPPTLIMTGETCELSETSQVFGKRACHIHCGNLAFCTTQKAGEPFPDVSSQAEEAWEQVGGQLPQK